MYLSHIFAFVSGQNSKIEIINIKEIETCLVKKLKIII
jgi:hypothetical protein